LLEDATENAKHINRPLLDDLDPPLKPIASEDAAIHQANIDLYIIGCSVSRVQFSQK